MNALAQRISGWFGASRDDLGAITPIRRKDYGRVDARASVQGVDQALVWITVALLAFGSGPVRGFAVAISVGIVTSMFTAILVVRQMIVIWMKSARPKTLAV